MHFDNLSHEAKELILWVENTEYFYSTINKSFTRHLKRGDFSYDRAHKWLVFTLLRSAAKDYHLANGSMADHWTTIFPISVRKEAADYLVTSVKTELLIQLSEAIPA